MSLLPRQVLHTTALILICVSSLIGCSSDGPTKEDVTLTLTEWLDEQFEEQLMRSPMNLTYIGRNERKGELDEFTLAAYQEDLAWQAASVSEMENRYSRATLSESEQLSYEDRKSVV